MYDTNASPAFAGLFSAWSLGWVSAPINSVETDESCSGIRPLTSISCASYRMARAVNFKTGRIVERSRADDRCKSKALLIACGESPYTVLRRVSATL